MTSIMSSRQFSDAWSTAVRGNCVPLVVVTSFGLLAGFAGYVLTNWIAMQWQLRADRTEVAAHEDVTIVNSTGNNAAMLALVYTGITMVFLVPALGWRLMKARAARAARY